jgi:hypothetical protein
MSPINVGRSLAYNDDIGHSHRIESDWKIVVFGNKKTCTLLLHTRRVYTKFLILKRSRDYESKLVSLNYI